AGSPVRCRALRRSRPSRRLLGQFRRRPYLKYCPTVTQQRRTRRRQPAGLRLWLVPMALLGGIALIVFASLYLLDHHVTGGISDPSPKTALGRYVRFEPTLISDALSGLAGMTAAVLGIVITVVSLLVQLTSERYT